MIMKDNQEREILEIMQEMQYATVEQLANKLYLSPSSVRRKLNDLQTKGLIIRTHGGANGRTNPILYPRPPRAS